LLRPLERRNDLARRPEPLRSKDQIPKGLDAFPGCLRPNGYGRHDDRFAAARGLLSPRKRKLRRLLRAGRVLEVWAQPPNEAVALLLGAVGVQGDELFEDLL